EDVSEPTPPSPIPITTPPPPLQELPSTSQARQDSSSSRDYKVKTKGQEIRKEDEVKSVWVEKIKEGWDYSKVKSSADTVMDDQEDASKQRGIIANIDADKYVTLEEVEVEKNAEVENNTDVQGRLEESQAKVYHIDLEHTD
nr:hypothetical protein [Tanacetum cinerariifolium]